MRNTLRVLLAGVAIASVVGCGDDVVVNPPDINTVAVSVSPQSQTIAKGQSFTAVANVSGGPAGTVTTVSWASTNNAAATVSASGVVTGVAAGVATITATSTANPAKVGAVVVTVTDGSGTNTIKMLVVTPQTVTLGVNGTQTLTPTGTCDAGVANCSSVTWTTANAAVATVDANGLVTGKAVGTTTVTAASTINPNLRVPVTVTVQAASANITGISVSPNAITIAPGGAGTVITPNVAIVAGSGAARTVTCSSAAPSVATVATAANGLSCTVTGVANGTTSVNVASTADPAFVAQVAVTVREPVAARVSIQSLTVNGNTTATVDPRNVVGIVDVNLSFDPGDQRVTSIDLYSIAAPANGSCAGVAVPAGATPIARQTFSAVLADAYRAASQGAAADVQPITFQGVNTAAFNSATGAPTFANGNYCLIAQVSGGATQLAANSYTATFNNANASFVSYTTVLPAGDTRNLSASDAAGVTWRAGNVVVTVIPVVYTPASPINAVTVTYNRNGAALVGGAALGPVTQTATLANGVYTATFAGATGLVPAAASLTGYASNNGADPITVSVAIGGSTPGAFGNPVQANGLPATAASLAARIDNQAPEPYASAVVPSTNFTGNTLTGQTAGFINGAFNFATGVTLTFPTLQKDNGGVDVVTSQFFAGPQTTPAALVSSGTQVTTGAQLAETNPTSNTANNLALRVADALGNARADIVNTGAALINGVAGGAVVFGVDLTAPTLAQTAGPTSNTISTLAQTYTFGATDNVGFGANILSVLGSRIRRNPDNPATPGALTTECFTGVTGGNATFGAVPAAGCARIVVPGSFTVTNALSGQYTLDVQARDQAGNVSSSLVRNGLIDVLAPAVVNGINIPSSFPAAGGSFTVNGPTATDNLELASQLAVVQYAAVASIRYDGAAIATPFDNTLVSSQALSVSIPSFLRSVETAAPAPSGAPQVPTNLTMAVQDHPLSTTYSTVDNIPAASLPATTSSFATASNITNVASFALTSSATNVFIAGGTAATRSITFTSTENGTINTYISPLQTVQLWIQEPLPGTPPAGFSPAYRVIGTLSAGLVQDAGGVRSVARTITFAPASVTGVVAGTFNFVAAGLSNDGRALITAPVAITIAP